MFFISVVVFSASCNRSSVSKTTCKPMVVFDYSDFGPQAMAFEFIGNEWWQWLEQGNGNINTKYPIKVVVHTDTKLSVAKIKYPVNKANKNDYRYVSYSSTLNYLDANLLELALFEKDGQSFDELIDTLRVTKERLEKEVCQK